MQGLSKYTNSDGYIEKDRGGEWYSVEAADAELQELLDDIDRLEKENQELEDKYDNLVYAIDQLLP